MIEDGKFSFQDFEDEIVSIVMPVYNTPITLFQSSVNSILDQTYANIELIIVDDGSKETNAKSYDNISYCDKRIKLIHIDNSGVSAARNVGIKESRGQYIVFIDSDDFMNKDAIRIMKAYIDNVDFVSISCKHVNSIENDPDDDVGQFYMYEKDNCLRSLCYNRAPVPFLETNAVWGKMYKREIIEKIHFNENVIMGEDFLFNYDYIMHSKMGGYLDFKGYYYYRHPESISSSYNPKMIKTVSEMQNLILNNIEKKAYLPLISRCVNIAFTIYMMLPDESQEDEKKIWQFIEKYRKKVTFNFASPIKVRAAAFLSYLGKKMVRNMFINGYGNKKERV